MLHLMEQKTIKLGHRINYRFKRFIKSFVSIFASREFAFVYCLIGTFGQITHSYFLLYSVSSFIGWFRGFQAAVLSIFISSSLLYFVAIADKDDEKHEYKRIMRAVNMFMIIEIAINFYYYAQNLLIKVPQLRTFDFIFAVIISCLLPITIKLYANSIKAKQWLKEFEAETESDVLFRAEMDESGLSEKISTIAKEISNQIFEENKANLLIEIQKIKKEENSSYNLDVERLGSSIKEEILNQLKENGIKPSTVEDSTIEELKEFSKNMIDSMMKENMKLFLQQFDNKVKYAIRQYGIETKNKQFTDTEK